MKVGKKSCTCPAGNKITVCLMMAEVKRQAQGPITDLDFRRSRTKNIFNLVIECLCSLAQKIENFKNRFTHIPSENGMMHNRFILYRREGGTFYIWHWQTPSRWKSSEREQCVDPEELEGDREREWERELVTCTFSAPWRETSPCWKVIRRAIPPREMSCREKLFYREKTGFQCFQHNLRYNT